MGHQRRWRGGVAAVVVAGAVVFGWAVTPPARGADADRAEGAAALVPEDAVFFSSSLRMREQIEAILHSRAWAKIKSLPSVQMAWQHAEAELKKPNGQLAPLVQFYQQPENQQLIALLRDMGSHEMFFYGGHSWIDFSDATAELYGSVLQSFNTLNPVQLQNAGADQQKMIAQMILNDLAKHAGQLKVPSLVLGFKVTDTKRAEDQIRRLETLARQQLEQNPQLKGRLQRKSVAGSSLLTLTLDGRMLPWDQMNLKQFEDRPGQYDDLVKKLKALKFTVGLGVHKGYVVLSLGESTRAVARLGEGKPLADRPEFEPLKKFADRRLTSIEYASKAFLSRFTGGGINTDYLSLRLKPLFDGLDVPADKREKINQDLKDLARQVNKSMPEVGAALSFTFATDRGQESYSYDWTKYPDLDASKPLTLLNHVGGSPLLAFVGRSKSDPKGYEALVQWLKKFYGDVEGIALDKLQGEQKDKYEEVTKVVFPLLKRANEVTAKMLLPALRDGQCAFVLDAKIKSKQWVSVLPATDQALPMLEPALVFGVSDAPLLRRALAEYRSIVNDGLAKARDFAPDMPEITIPAPETKNVPGGILYYYALPPLVDEQLLPNAGLSEHVGVLSLSPGQARRILASTPLRTTGGPLADLKRPLSSAAYVNWPAVVDTLEPWIEFGIRTGGERLQDVAGADAEGIKKAVGGVDGLLKQVRTVLEVARVIRGYSSATYLDNGVLVTHGETVIRDIK